MVDLFWAIGLEKKQDLSLTFTFNFTFFSCLNLKNVFAILSYLKFLHLHG